MGSCVSRGLAVIALLCALASATTARAERRRALAVGAVVIPGVVFHGAGHLVAGDRATGVRLLLGEAVGVWLYAFGCLPVQASGAAPQTLPLLSMCIPGSSLFLQTWLADLYGTVGGARWHGAPPAPPLVEVEGGYTWVGREATSVATVDVTAQLDRFRLATSDYAGADLWGLRGELGYRAVARGGASLEVVAGASHADGVGFALSTLEASVIGRYELAQFAPSLAGSYASVQVGAAYEWIHYAPESAPVDTSSLLIARAAYGVRVGEHVVAELGYDQRRDALAGNVVVARTTFAMGHVEGRVVAAGERFGVAVAVERGSAWVAHVGLIARLGGHLRGRVMPY